MHYVQKYMKVIGFYPLTNIVHSEDVAASGPAAAGGIDWGIIV